MQVCKLDTNYAITFYKCSGKKFGRTSIKRCFLIYEESWQNIRLSMVIETKELYHWEKTHASVITLLMANIVWAILIPQIYIDFHGWENCTYKRKLLLNLIQTSENNK